MAEVMRSRQITGVLHLQLRPFADVRGQFAEIFRKEWFPDRKWQTIQSNRSESVAGVLRGLHYHHKQVDYWHVVRGSIRACLVDLRISSPTQGNVETVDMHGDQFVGLYIPVGVAHGFVAYSGASFIYIVDNYYDGSDEYGLAWNDPDLAIDWGIDKPLISERDRNNPFLRDIDRKNLPVYPDHSPSS